MKTFITNLLALTFLFAFALPASAWDITFENKKLQASETAWLDENNQLMVSIATLVPEFIDAYAFNFDGWQITMVGNNFGITAMVTSPKMERDGFSATFNAKPLVKDKTLWIPIEALASIMNYQTSKDLKKETLTISKNKTTITQEQEEEIRLRRMTSVSNNAKFLRPEIAYFEDILIPAEQGFVTARLYDANPNDTKPRAAYINIHGGAYSLGSIASSDHVCRDIATRSGQKVISIDYRMLPENPFPAAWDDAYAALKWTFENAKELGINPNKIYIGGDSAGASIATSTAMKARDEDKFTLAGQVLAYPVVTLNNGKWDSLFTDKKDASNPYATVTQGELKNMPSTLLLVAEDDTIREDGTLYAEALKKAGVKTDFEVVQNTKHGFLATHAASRERIAKFIQQ